MVVVRAPGAMIVLVDGGGGSCGGLGGSGLERSVRGDALVCCVGGGCGVAWDASGGWIGSVSG